MSDDVRIAELTARLAETEKMLAESDAVIAVLAEDNCWKCSGSLYMRDLNAALSRHKGRSTPTQPGAPDGK